MGGAIGFQMLRVEYRAGGYMLDMGSEALAHRFVSLTCGDYEKQEGEGIEKESHVAGYIGAWCW
jgi:hypothetical protein